MEKIITFRYGFDLTNCDGSVNCSNTSYPEIPCDQGYYYDKSLFSETIVTEVRKYFL